MSRAVRSTSPPTAGRGPGQCIAVPVKPPVVRIGGGLYQRHPSSIKSVPVHGAEHVKKSRTLVCCSWGEFASHGAPLHVCFFRNPTKRWKRQVQLDSGVHSSCLARAFRAGDGYAGHGQGKKEDKFRNGCVTPFVGLRSQCVAVHPVVQV